MNPQNAPASGCGSDALLELKRHEATLESCDKAIALKPDDAEAYKNRGNALLALKQHEAAIRSYDRAILLKPDYADAYYNRANVLNVIGQHDGAIQSFDRAIALNPDDAEAYNNRGIALQALKRLDAAIRSFDQAIALDPGYADAFNNRGNTLKELKRYDEALACYEKALSIKPDHAEALNNRSNALHELKRHDEALASYDQALSIMPGDVDALVNRGLTLHELKRHDEALACYEKALSIKPDFAEASYNRGNALQELKRYDEALASYDRALSINPDFAGALSNRGNVLQELKRYDEALASYDQALSIKPDFAEASYNRGNALQELKRYDEALACYEQALSIKPDFAGALSNRGLTLHELKRYDEALACYEKALSIKPDFAGALSNRGNTLKELKCYDEALACYEKALSIKPDFAEGLVNRGNALQDLKRLDEALESYAGALKIKPDYDFLYGTWLYTKMKIGDWSDAESQFTQLFRLIQRNEKVTPSFPVLALTGSLPLQRRAAEIWANDKHPASLALPPIPKYARHEKIRIGYFSGDFGDHPVSHLTAELFELHDRTKFEVIAFSLERDGNDEMRNRLVRAFERFLDVQGHSDKDVAQLARTLEIDIAVDLGGYTKGSRTGIFAMRAAPIQVSYLGYPGTMGTECIDYLIADNTLIPEVSRQYYMEKIAYLPDSYLVNDSKRAIAKKAFSREELGLPSAGFVFCCFNNSYKITPATFDGWMRILNRAEGSVLWLREDNPAAARNLRREAETRGVNAARLIFAKRMPLLEEHLARHRAADLFIDTLPYNAHTTASDALWAGLPVLTCMGEAFASRVAASLLNAIDLPELITTTQEQYEALAVELANNPERLKRIKQKLERNRLTTRLFDTELFKKHIEAAYTQMYERYQADLPLEHIYVSQ